MNNRAAVMKTAPALDGGTPVRETLLPYARQTVDDGDVEAVTKVLCSDWLTTGPKVVEFEREFARAVGSGEAVAVSSGTAALHAAMRAANVGPGSEVIVPSMTFVSTVNSVVFQGGTPVFLDSEPETLLIDPAKVEDAITSNTKAIVAVDYAGHSADYDAILGIAGLHDIPVIADACHALGGSYKARPVGSLATLNCFSFHPVKPLAMGEGGAVTTNNANLAGVMRMFRNHCLSSDHRERHETGSWEYDADDLGYNYRLTDIQCALGLSQLQKVSEWMGRRQEIAECYNDAFSGMGALKPLTVRANVSHAYHLYVVLLNLERLTVDRARIFQALRAENIGINVHYKPAHLHTFYRRTFGTGPGLCPVAEAAYERMISLPIFAGMTGRDVCDVIEAVRKVCAYYTV